MLRHRWDKGTRILFFERLKRREGQEKQALRGALAKAQATLSSVVLFGGGGLRYGASESVHLCVNTKL